MKPVNLFGAGMVGKSAVATAERMLNAYYEIRPDGDKNKVVIYGTPGLTQFISFGDTPVRGWRVMGNLLYAVHRGTLWEITSAGVKTSRGTLNTTSGLVSMSDNGTQLSIVDGTNGYIFNPGTLAFSQIVSAGFPNGATTIAFLGGFFVVEQPNSGKFFKSASYDGLTWSALDFATCESNPDYLVAVQEDHGLLLMFGTATIEFWQNSGALDFPFAPIIGATQQCGLAARFSRAKVDNTVMFLSSANEGRVQVMQIGGPVGYSATRVSTHDLENIINAFSVVSDAVALSYMLDGHPMYQISFPTASRSFLYDASTSIWSEVQTGVALSARHTANLGVTFGSKNYMSDYSSGNVYLLDPSAYTDNGTPIKRLLQTRHVLEGYNEFNVPEIFLDMETGVGVQVGQGSNPQVMLQISKDGGRVFGNERWTSLGMVGQYKGPRVTWRRCGQARDMVIRVAMTDPVKFAVINAGMNVRPGKG